MPQLFQVLRCFKCLVFQVHQTKKTNKWECKLCGEKQSVKRHHGLGTAKDCRIHVQKLNSMRGEIDTLKNNQDSVNSETEGDVAPNIKENQHPSIDSKWSNYIEDQETVETNSNENMTLGDEEVVLEIPKKRRKQNNNNYNRNPKLFLTSVDDNNKRQENYQKETSSVISSITVANTISIQSKIPQPNLFSEELTVKEKSENISRNTTQKKFIPTVLNKDSKWAQFTEDTEENEETDILPLSPSIETSKNYLLFSLCDDSDLDNVLNI